MSPKAPPARALSPLIVVDGFVLGWAFDPLRPVLRLELTVDGHTVASGLSGHGVADSVFALALPPKPNCGFSLPLPAQARDGRSHRLLVRVPDWQALPDAPKAELSWFEGPCFGEVNLSAQQYYEGWVGFRKNWPAGKLPPVTVRDLSGDGPALAINLSPEPERRIDGSRLLAKFRVSRTRLRALREPEFSCLGQTLLQREAAPPRCKPAGSLERVSPEGIKGWLFNASNPSELLDAVLVIDELPFRVIRPHIRRADVARHLQLLPEELGLCGFDIDLPQILKDGRPHTVALRCKADGSTLSPEPLHYHHKLPGLTLDEAHAALGLPAPDEHSAPVKKRRSAKTAAGKAQVTVVILNRNGAPCLDGLFASFMRHNTVAVEFIVFDHASRDDSVAVVKRWAEHLPIRLEALDRNFSFSVSCNQGARLAKTPYVLFLNNDIVWLQDALPPMLASLKSRKVGLVGLRLLKTTFATDGRSLDNNGSPEVQHLGVRFNLVNGRYWPYELTPETAPLEQQYSPQDVPVVTGAVLLCRRDQFLEQGGFDEGYVYGFEDVELCLRLRERAGLSSLCRNDLVALHHHGYTRLTGREPSMLEQQQGNTRRLHDTLGLWLKRRYWASLLAGDGLYASEPFTIGFAIGTDKEQRELQAALTLGQALRQQYPHCRLLFLRADRDWDQVSDCHAIVALNPHYDPRALLSPRGDLRLALYLHDADSAAQWQGNPALADFDLCLHADNPALKKAARQLADSTTLMASTPAAPLGTLLQAERLRLVLKTERHHPRLDELVLGLRKQGALVSLAPPLRPRARALPQAVPYYPRVADVVLTLCETNLLRNPDFVYERDDSALNVLWVLNGNEHLRGQALEATDELWLAGGSLPADLKQAVRKLRTVAPNPSALKRVISQLQKSVETKIGRSFSSS